MSENAPVQVVMTSLLKTSAEYENADIRRLVVDVAEALARAGWLHDPDERRRWHEAQIALAERTARLEAVAATASDLHRACHGTVGNGGLDALLAKLATAIDALPPADEPASAPPPQGEAKANAELSAELDAMTRRRAVARDMLAEAQSTIRLLTVDLAAARAEVAALRTVVNEVAWMFRGTGEAEDGVHVTATGVARLLALLDALPPSDQP